MIGRPLCVLIFIAFFAAAQAAALEIPLEQHGEVYTLPVLVNGVITLNFILDTGASEVVIPFNFVSTLMRAGTITEKDFLPGKSFKTADGSVVRSSRFRIRELNIQGYRVFDVPGVVSSVTGIPLLGQSFLSRVESWTLDNRAHKLILSGPEAKQPGPASYGPQTPPQPENKKPRPQNDKTVTSNADGKPKSVDTPVGEKAGEAKSSRPLIPPSVHMDALDQPNGSKPLIPPSVHP
jgi:hypothetical protein